MAQRLGGPRAAWLAATLTGVSLPQIWFAKLSVPETVAQCFVMAGVLAWLVARPSLAVVGHPLWDDALAQSARVARMFPDNAVVLMSPDLAGTHIPTSLAYLHDVDTILVQERQPNDQLMGRVIHDWLARGWAVFVVFDRHDFSFFAPELSLAEVGRTSVDIRTLERTFTRAPQAVVHQPIRLQLLQVAPYVGADRTVVDIGTPADDLLYDLRGFHAGEHDADPTQVPVDRRARGPHAAGGSRRHARVGGGRPAGTPPAEISVWVREHPVLFYAEV